MNKKPSKKVDHLPTDWLDKLNQLIIDNLSDNNLNNARLAKELFISERSFYRNVLDKTGLTPNHYIRHIRLQKAKEFLESGAFETVKEVGLSVGFKKSIYFSRLFKEKFGVYPVDILNNKDTIQ